MSAGGISRNVDLARFQQTVGQRLLVWAGFNILAGLILLGQGAFWQGFGIQALVWGFIDAAIALGGESSRRRKPWGAFSPADLARESRRFRRLLLFNAGLDVLYVLAGVVIAGQWGVANPLWRGHGFGVIVQGAFLFGFDLLHARLLPDRREDG